ERIARNLHLRKLLTGELYGPLTGKPGIDKPWLLEFPEETIKNFPFIGKTVFRYLYDNNIGHLDDVVIVFEGKEITNREFIESIIDTASALKKMGVKEGDFVSVCLPNTPESACFLYACSILGAVADFIDPIASEEGLKSYLDISNPKYLITMDMAYDKFKNLIKEKGITDVIVTSPVESLIPSDDERIEEDNLAFQARDCEYMESTSANIRTFKKFMKDGRGAYTLEEMEVPYEPLRPVSVVHSGGTTGTPKGVLMSNDNLNSFATQIMNTTLGYKRDNTLLSLMPEFVGYGLSLGLHVARVAGMKTYMIPKYIPEEIDELIAKFKPNVVTGSPAHLELFAESEMLRNEKVDLSGLDSFIVGGSAIHPKVENKGNGLLFENGSSNKVKKGYGFTENNCAVTMCINNEVNELGGCGVPLPFTEVTIYDNKNQRDCGYDEEGEVCVTGPDLMLEYLNNLEENKLALRVHSDGKVWFHSGDLGVINKRGLFKCTGRIKDLIIRYNGQKVYPDDVEKLLSAHVDVKYISLVGTQDKDHFNGEVPIAFVVFNEGATLETSKSSLKDFAEEKLVSYAVPEEYFQIEAMPKTKTGKVDKKVLRPMVTLDEETKTYKMVPVGKKN
ncbi:MAG TPA: hypothetical protein DCY94_04355, partial [Firmicutes bacterium]|nr:hypothetical protein [Bacillota bacterium]